MPTTQLLQANPITIYGFEKHRLDGIQQKVK